MPSRKRRRFFVVASVITGLTLAAVGTFLGISATTVPDVLQGGFDERVSIWVDEPDTNVEASWSVDPAGNVSLYVGAGGPDPDAPSKTFRAFVVLTCDTRITDPHVEAGVDLEVRRFGSEELCRTPTVFSTDLATQLISVSVGGDAPGPTVISGSTVAPWVASGGGRRVARTPTIMLGRFDLFADELESYRLQAPGEDSKLSVSLDASPTETLDIFVPEGSEEATVTTSASIYDFGMASGPVVIGSVTWSTQGADAVLQSGFVRWNDSSGTAMAQLSLLLSGAFLGVAASFSIELIFEQVRARNSTPDDGEGARRSRDRVRPRRRPIAGEQRGRPRA
jgi:hypothetical protein